VVADESPTGRLAARIAGLLAGARGMLVTILTASAGDDGTVSGAPSAANGSEESSAAEIARAAADIPPREGGAAGTPIDIIERRHDLSWDAAVSAEARNGYDLFVIGVEPFVEPGATALRHALQGRRRDSQGDPRHRQCHRTAGAGRETHRHLFSRCYLARGPARGPRPHSARRKSPSRRPTVLRRAGGGVARQFRPIAPLPVA
jgi:hypothetical protein